jgi:hypothetical protein
MKKIIWNTLTAGILTLSVTVANAALIDNGDYTTDTNSGLNWLDLTLSLSRSYNDVEANLSTGGDFAGWRFATGLEVINLWASFGITSPVALSSRTYKAKYEGGRLFLDLLGNTRPYTETGRNPYTDGYVLNSNGGDAETYVVGLVCHVGPCLSGNTTGRGHTFEREQGVAPHINSPDYGSFLVQSTVVPVPAAVWLFGSGLIGLIGFARRKK